MRYLLLLLGLISTAYGQFQPTSAKTAFKNGISLGTRDSTAYTANDSLVVVINRQGRMMYRSTDGYWKILSNAAASDYVPYVGAVSNVFLGSNRIKADAFDLGIPSSSTDSIGRMRWNADDLTMNIGLTSSVVLQSGQEMLILVKNQTGVTIPNGTVVRQSGVVGASGRLKVEPFLANGTHNSNQVLGLTTEDIPNGGDGFVSYFGKVNGLNTAAYPDSTILYASPTVAGGLTNVVPEAPNNIVKIGTVVKSASSNGIIFTRVVAGSNINQDEGVQLTNPLNNSLLVYDSLTTLWKDKTLVEIGAVRVQDTAAMLNPYLRKSDTATMLSNYRRKTTLIENADLRNSAITINGSSTALGGSISVGTVTSVAASAGTGISVSGSPITGSGTLTITNTAPDQTVTLTAGTGISVSGTYPNFTVTNTSPSSGGTVTSVTASAPLSSSGGTTPNITISQATTSTNGFLSSTDWNTFNNKQAQLNGTGFVRFSGTTPSYITGTSSQFVKADGSLDGTSYATAASISGTTNYIPKFTSGTAIGNSQIFDNGTAVGINTASPDAAFATTILNNGDYKGLLVTGSENQLIQIRSTTAARQSVLSLKSGSKEYSVGLNTDNSFSIYDNTAAATRFSITSAGAASFTGSLSGTSLSMSGGVFDVASGALSADILRVKGGGGSGVFGFKVEANNGDDIFYTDNFNYNVVSNPVAGTFLIGTTTTDGTNKLIVNGGVKGTSLNIVTDATAVGGVKLSPTTNTFGSAYEASNAGGTAYFGKNSSSGGAFGGDAYSTVVYSGGAYPLEFYTNDTKRVSIASTGAATFSSSVTATGLQAKGSSLNVNNTIKFLRADNTEMGYIGWSNESANNSNWLFRSSNQNPIAFSADGTNNNLLISSTGAATFSSSVTATGFFESSSKKLKDIFWQSKQEDNIDFIGFTWKKSLNLDTKKHLGVIAEQVEKVLPDAVNTNDKGVKSVNYNEVLIYKLERLTKKVAELEKKLERYSKKAKTKN